MLLFSNVNDTGRLVLAHLPAFLLVNSCHNKLVLVVS